MNVFAIDFPPISHVVEWPDLFFKGSVFAVNKVVLLMWLTVVLVFGFFMLAGRKQQLVPTGIQAVAESAIDFVRNGIILQTIGPDGLPWTPFLATLFTFVFVGNLWEIIPGAQMPVNARIAFPALMAITVWLLYHFVGIKTQGLIHYLKSNMFIPGVPKPIVPLLTLIETITFLVTQPLSLAVRLFANMLAGHMLLVSFSTISAALWAAGPTIGILPFSFGLLVGLTGFEIFVAFLQAFIFCMLTGVYIGKSLHPDH